MKNSFARLNDGVAYIYADKGKRSNFNARENTRSIEDMEFVCKLDYEQMSKRQQDQDFANQNGHSLSMKIRTRCVAGISSKHKVVIENTLYDIYDLDKTRTEMYLYLEEVRTLDT